MELRAPLGAKCVRELVVKNTPMTGRVVATREQDTHGAGHAAPAFAKARRVGGMMSIAVITVCDEKVALSDAICGGLPCEGGINSTSRRRTTAIANDAEPEPSEKP